MQKNTHIPTQIIICGITGDLSRKKIIPSLFSLYCEGALPQELNIIGFSRRDFSTEEIQQFINPLLPDHTQKEAFLNLFSYVAGNFSDIEAYEKLKKHVDTIDDTYMRCSNKLYYLSVSPQFYETVFNHIYTSGLGTPCDDMVGWARILVEKPFGYSIESSKTLNALVDRLFKREQIYRIDHYMAKTSLQKIIDVRMQPDMQKKWNSTYIDHIDISLLEQATVEGRGEFYDSLGVVYDVVQNHILQMIALALREIQVHQTAHDIQKAREQVFTSLSVMQNSSHPLYRAQYNTYRTHAGVHPQSETETYVDVTLTSTLPQYIGVPLRIRSGKALSESRTEVVVVWKDGTESIFNTPSSESQGAYKRVLLDCIQGDQQVFTSGIEVVDSWHVAEHVKDIINTIPLHTYAVGEDPEK